MLRRGEDVSYDVLIEREREKLKLNQQALETTESQMKALETSSQLSQKQEEWKQARQAHMKARKAYESAWKRQSRIPASSLRQHMETQRQQAETACIKSLQQAGYTYSQADVPAVWLQSQYASLTQSITGLRVDVRRGSKNGKN